MLNLAAVNAGEPRPTRDWWWPVLVFGAAWLVGVSWAIFRVAAGWPL